MLGNVNMSSMGFPWQTKAFKCINVTRPDWKSSQQTSEKSAQFSTGKFRRGHKPSFPQTNTNNPKRCTCSRFLAHLETLPHFKQFLRLYSQRPTWECLSGNVEAIQPISAKYISRKGICLWRVLSSWACESSRIGKRECVSEVICLWCRRERRST